MKKFPVIDMRATGTRIKEIRSSQNFTVQEISEYMGFENPQAVYKWQRGEALPTVDNLFALSKGYLTNTVVTPITFVVV